MSLRVSVTSDSSAEVKSLNPSSCFFANVCAYDFSKQRIVKLAVASKAVSEIVTTDSGTRTFLSWGQSANALSSISVTPSGIVTSRIFVLLAKALSPIATTVISSIVSGIVTNFSSPL